MCPSKELNYLLNVHKILPRHKTFYQYLVVQNCLAVLHIIGKETQIEQVEYQMHIGLYQAEKILSNYLINSKQ